MWLIKAALRGALYGVRGTLPAFNVNCRAGFLPKYSTNFDQLLKCAPAFLNGLNLPAPILMPLGKDVSVSLAPSQISAGQELRGTVTVSYPGRWDSVVINSQIENSSDVFSYPTLNGKKINHPYARLSIFKADLGGKTVIEFVATTKHVPAGDHSSVKFRVSIIQEHKEVVSDIAYIKVVKD